ncbi:hypothetical protein MMPV_008047 [Pyropia vietnamensis]
MGSLHMHRSSSLRIAEVLAVIAAATAVVAAASAVRGGAPYPTGREPLMSPEEIASTLLPPGVACGKPLPGTNHTLNCGTGGGRSVHLGAIVLEPVAGGGGSGCPPITLLFLHGQSTAPLVDYLPLVTIFARLPAAAGVRIVMPLAPHHPFVRVAAADGSAEAGAFAWYNLYQPPTEGIAATIAATTDKERVSVAAAHPWAVDSLGLALSTSRLVHIVAVEAAADRRVVVIGHSLGSGMTLHLSAVLGRTGLSDVVDHLDGALAISGLLPLADLHVVGAINTTTAPPVVLLHGEDDETIPAAAGRLAAAVWAAGGGGARFRAVPGAGHSTVLQSTPMVEEATAVLTGASRLAVSGRRHQSAVAAGGLSRRAASPLVMETISFEKLEDVLNTPTSKIAKYALTLRVAGTTSSLVRKETVASAKKTIKAPGFRPGVIPPFMRATIQEFILTECLQTEIARAVDEAGLLPCEGDASAPEFAIPIKQMNKVFEPGKPFEFSCEVALMSKDMDADADAASSEAQEGADESEVPAPGKAEVPSEPEADAVENVMPVADKAQEAS